MAAQYKAPGVYIVDQNSFHDSVVAVDTAVPAFIGYTDTALDGTLNLVGQPRLISSMADYTRCFGGPPPVSLTYDDTARNKGMVYLTPKAGSKFYLYYSLHLYFANGGAPCYVISTGSYTQTPGAEDFIGVLDELTRHAEPTILVAPDVIVLGAEGQKVVQAFLLHCNAMRSRIAIFDVLDGDRKRDPANDQIKTFRSWVGTQSLNYGAAYYPWLNTQIVDGVDFTAIDSGSISDFATALKSEATTLLPGDDSDTKAKLNKLTSQIDQITTLSVKRAAIVGNIANVSAVCGGATPTPGPNSTPAPSSTASQRYLQQMEQLQPQIKSLDQFLCATSPLYARVMSDVAATLNVLPPSGAIAGIYCLVDSTQGVFKAPVNVSLNAVASPTVDLSDYDQYDLNMPLDGKAVNAIRAFRGMGTLVWGARTLDGNNQDWRYINVRRTLIMLEQSIRHAMQPYAFTPNTATTWATVQNMIETFLTNQWKAGALAGGKATDAFSVAVGLNVTMTGDDIVDDVMRVVVKVAAVRAAEFIELTFEQKMQTS